MSPEIPRQFEDRKAKAGFGLAVSMAFHEAGQLESIPSFVEWMD
jgi:hypothetical protein